MFLMETGSFIHLITSSSKRGEEICDTRWKNTKHGNYKNSQITSASEFPNLKSTTNTKNMQPKTLTPHPPLPHNRKWINIKAWLKEKSFLSSGHLTPETSFLLQNLIMSREGNMSQPNPSRKHVLELLNWTRPLCAKTL